MYSKIYLKSIKLWKEAIRCEDTNFEYLIYRLTMSDTSLGQSGNNHITNHHHSRTPSDERTDLSQSDPSLNVS